MEVRSLLRLLWLFCIVIYTQGLWGSNENSAGVLLPKNPHVLVGETLKLNCILTDGPYNSSQITFRVGRQPISDRYVQIVNGTTAQLILPNMTMQNPPQTYTCEWPDISKFIFPAQVVQVSYPPGKPENLTCINYNWQRMVCRFSEGKQLDPLLKPTFALYYTIDHYSPDLYHCPKNLTEGLGCIWNEINGHDSFQDGKIYRIVVCAFHKLNRTCIRKDIDTRTIVKPNKVKSLQGKVLSSRSVAMSWKSPDPLNMRKVQYAVTVNSLQMQNNSIQTPNISFNNLTPNTEYQFAIKCRPLVEGFWSDPEVIILKTFTDVPAALPPYTKHNFQLLPLASKPNSVLASIYWQKLDPVLANGVLRKYRVTMKWFDPVSNGYGTETMQETFYRANTKLLMGQFDLIKNPNRGSFSFSVAAQSDKGYNESLSEKIISITPSSVLPPPSKVVALQQDGGGLLVNWTHVTDAVEYMLFWCYGKLPGTCEESVHWKKVDGDMHSTMLSLDNRFYMFAVSAAVSNGSVSGMSEWTKCTYIYGKATKAVSNFRLSDYQESSSLTVEWLPFKCSNHLYVIQYILSYCPSKDGICTDETQNITVDGYGDTDKYKIDNLKVDQEYRVWMYTVAPSGISNATVAVFAAVTISGLRSSQIAGIAVGAVLGSVLIAFSIYALCRKVRKILYPEQIRIMVPDRVEARNIQSVFMESDDVEDYIVDLPTPNSATELILSPFSGMKFKEGGQNGINGDVHRNGHAIHLRSTMSSGLDSLSSTNTMISRLNSDTESEDDCVFGNDPRHRHNSSTDKRPLQSVPEEHGGSPVHKTPVHNICVPRSGDDEYKKLAINMPEASESLTSPHEDDDELLCDSRQNFPHVYQQDILVEDSDPSYPVTYTLLNGDEDVKGTAPCLMNSNNNSNSYLEILPDPALYDGSVTATQSQSGEKDEEYGRREHFGKKPSLSQQLDVSHDSGSLCNYSKVGVATDAKEFVFTPSGYVVAREVGEQASVEPGKDSLNYIEVCPDATDSCDVDQVESSEGCEGQSSDTAGADGYLQMTGRQNSVNSPNFGNEHYVHMTSNAESQVLYENLESQKATTDSNNFEIPHDANGNTKVQGYISLSDDQ